MSLRRLRWAIATQPRHWPVLLCWPLAVLVLVLLRRVVGLGGGVVAAVEIILVLTALAALGLFAFLARGFYRGLRIVRDHLFEGHYDSALDATEVKARFEAGPRPKVGTE